MKFMYISFSKINKKQQQQKAPYLRPNQYSTSPGPNRCTYVSTCGSTLFVCVSTSPNNALFVIECMLLLSGVRVYVFQCKLSAHSSIVLTFESIQQMIFHSHSSSSSSSSSSKSFISFCFCVLSVLFVSVSSSLYNERRIPS